MALATLQLATCEREYLIASYLPNLPGTSVKDLSTLATFFGCFASVRFAAMSDYDERKFLVFYDASLSAPIEFSIEVDGTEMVTSRAADGTGSNGCDCGGLSNTIPVRIHISIIYFQSSTTICDVHTNPYGAFSNITTVVGFHWTYSQIKSYEVKPSFETKIKKIFKKSKQKVIYTRIEVEFILMEKELIWN